MKQLATEKQINYFNSLYKQWKRKLKFEYRYYDKKNYDVPLIESFARAISNNADDIKKSDISYAINVMKRELENK